MSAVFADTFYWIALTDFADRAHHRALAITAERATSSIITTDEVLAEYLTFFANALSRKAAALFCPVSIFTAPALIKATASPIASLWKQCAGKA